MQDASWQSVIVALSILGLLSAVTVMTIKKFSTVDEVLKVIGAFTGILGVVTGSFATYFFTRQPIHEAQKLATAYQERAVKAEQQMAAIERNTSSLLARLADMPDLTKLEALKSDPAISFFLKNYGTLATIPRSQDPG